MHSLRFPKQTESEACSHIGTSTLRSDLKLICNSKWPVLCGREMVGRLYRHMIAKRKVCFPEMWDSVIDSLSHWKIELFARNIQVVFFHLCNFCFFSFAFSLSSIYSFSNVWQLVPLSSFLYEFPFPRLVRHPFVSLPHFSYILIFNHWGPSIFFIICLISCRFLFCFFSSCFVCIICPFWVLVLDYWQYSGFPVPFLSLSI